MHTDICNLRFGDIGSEILPNQCSLQEKWV
jgi:hypothetical protein